MEQLSERAKEAQVNHLAHIIAEQASRSALESNCIIRGLDWLEIDPDDPYTGGLKDEARYLELRGLIERHPDNPTWMRILEATR